MMASAFWLLTWVKLSAAGPKGVWRHKTDEELVSEEIF
jgi:hypothetical protein